MVGYLPLHKILALISTTSSPSDLRFALRRGTHADHERLDAAAMRFDLGTIDDHRAFLTWNAALVPPIEEHLTRSGIEALLPDWPQRRRTEALVSDLRALDAEWPRPNPVDLPTDKAALVGIAYVLEGSRLGNAVLVKSVDPSLRGKATAYFEHGAGGNYWRSFVETINALALSPEGTQTAIDAARRTFALFEAALYRAQSETESRAVS